jgi:uncharacterized membrane protein YphA (DoxX/SURF4 family)
MAPTRRIARPLLASVFIAGGVDALRDPEAKAKAAQAVTVPLSRQFPALPDDPELLVRINGAVQVGAGVLLAVGRFRRLAAVALIASIIPTTYAGHRFWEEDDDVTRAQQQVHFLKNLGLLGGLILAAADTEGEPSLGWRARRRAARIGAAVAIGKGSGSSSARGVGSSVADGAGTLARHAQDAAVEVGRHLDHGASRASYHAQDIAIRAARQADLTGRHLADTLPGAGQQLGDVLAGVRQRASDSVSQAALLSR